MSQIDFEILMIEYRSVGYEITMRLHQIDITPSRKQLRQLFLLRNITITGIVTIVLVSWLGMNISLDIANLSITIGLLILFNGFVWLRVSKVKHEVNQVEFFIHLIIDTSFFAILLYQAGGASNPFGLVFLIPIIISAIILPSAYTWVLSLIAISCYSYLVWIYQPDHNMTHGNNDSFSLHVMGMWSGFVFGTLIVSYFITRIGKLLREQQSELHLAHEQAVRDEQLVALGTLAASTAHELNTPLGTIALIAQEIAEVSPSEETRTQINILKSQVDRCKNALSNLSACAGDLSANGGRILPVDNFLNSLLHDWKQRRLEVNIRFSMDGDQPAPEIIADDSLVHAINNILDNAADVSPENLELTAKWDACSLELDIYDRGPGLGGEALNHLGKRPYSDKQEGMGLGLFIAFAVIQRFGGDVTLMNRDSGGIQTHINLPLGSIS